MASIAISPWARLSLVFQRLLGWLFFVLVGPCSVFTMRILRNNRLEGVAEVRRRYKEALATGKPTLIVANHLTMVDSAYLQWALCPLWEYLFSYRKFPWNVAAVEHLKSRPPLLVICYLGKVLPIDRDGTEEHRKGVLDKLRWLLERGEVAMLFPEGTRSRTGRIDVENTTYGVGQILKDIENPQVLCAYIRGKRQEQMSSVPHKHDTVHIELELFEPRTTQQGLRAVRDLSRQVIVKLKEMEDRRLGPAPAEKV
jgi:1-acyl-sn-glycerol-3-phosphate acyltransferase